jgi:hypothetical protein
MTINLSPLGADLNAWLLQATDEGRDVRALQEQVSTTCSTFKDPAQATIALLDLGDSFKREGFTDESEPLKLIAEQTDVLAQAAMPQSEAHPEDVAELVERRIIRIQDNWARAEAEAEVDGEQDPELHEAKKRSLEETKEGLLAMLLDANDVLSAIKRRRTEKEDAKPAAEAPAAAEPAEKLAAAPSKDEAPAAKREEAAAPSGDSAPAEAPKQ